MESAKPVGRNSRDPVDMKCAVCSRVNEPGRKFCGRCGAALVAICGHCGFVNKPDDHFCGGCGASLARPHTDGRTAFSAALNQTPVDLAKQILASRDVIEGEHKFVTVMFADISSSTTRIQGLDPEDMLEVLDPPIKAMVDAVHEFDGTVCRVDGDGIMALFGAPLAQEDHAVRACNAALAIQRNAKHLPDGDVAIRVGLNSGNVIVRSIHNDLSMQYDAIGETTYLAARMEQLANPGEIYLAEATRDLAAGFVEVRPLGPTPVKGISTPLPVYALTGRKAEISRWQVRTTRGLSQFIGRETELNQIAAAAEKAFHGEGQVFALVGDAGLGKSRFIHEFVTSAAAKPAGCVQVSTRPYEATHAYATFLSLLRAFFGVRAGDTAERRENKVRAGLTALDEKLLNDAPVFLALLDPASADDAWQALPPREKQKKILAVAKRLTISACRHQPLILVVEDLHWIDSESEQILDQVVETLKQQPVLVVVSFRPSYPGRWLDRTEHAIARLDPLAEPQMRLMVDGLLGEASGLKGLKSQLLERSGGNPLFAEELVLSIIEDGSLSPRNGSYRLKTPIRSLRFPVSLQSVVSSRIDRLSGQAKSLLQTAAVIGSKVSQDMLAQIAGLPLEGVEHYADELSRAELIYRSSVLPEPEYSFQHSIFQDVAYNGLLEDTRRRLHRQIFEVLESTFERDNSALVEDLARHASSGQLWEKAAQYHHMAARQALGRSALRDGAHHAEAALMAFRNLPTEPESTGELVDLLCDLGVLLWTLGGESERQLEYLKQAEALARKAGDDVRLGWVMAHMAAHHWILSDYGNSLKVARQARDIAVETGVPDLVAVGHFRLGLAKHSTGDYAEAIHDLGQTAALLTGDKVNQRLGMAGLPACFARNFAAMCHSERGAFETAEALIGEADRIATGAGDAYSIVASFIARGRLQLQRGAFDESIAILSKALAIAEATEATSVFTMVASCLGLAEVQIGQLREGLEHMEQSVSSDMWEVSPQHSLPFVYLAEGYLAAGRHADAEAALEKGLTLAERNSEMGFLAWGHRTAGNIMAELADDPETAARSYRTAMEIAEDHGMRPLMAHCHLGLGRLLEKRPGNGDAGDHLRSARAAYEEMGMTTWLERAVSD